MKKQDLKKMALAGLIGGTMLASQGAVEALDLSSSSQTLLAGQCGGESGCGHKGNGNNGGRNDGGYQAYRNTSSSSRNYQPQSGCGGAKQPPANIPSQGLNPPSASYYYTADNEKTSSSSNPNMAPMMEDNTAKPAKPANGTKPTSPTNGTKPASGCGAAKPANGQNR